MSKHRVTDILDCRGMNPHQGAHIWFPSSQAGSVMLIFDQKLSWGSIWHFLQCICGLPVVIINLHLGGFCPQSTRAFVPPFKDGGAAYVFVGVAISSCSRQSGWKAWDIPRTTQALCAAQTPPGTRNMTSTYHSSICVCLCVGGVGWTQDIFPYLHFCSGQLCSRVHTPVPTILSAAFHDSCDICLSGHEDGTGRPTKLEFIFQQWSRRRLNQQETPSITFPNPILFEQILYE